MEKDSRPIGTKVRVEGEDLILHTTDRSVMFEKGCRVNGFERSATRLLKPDGDATISAYSAPVNQGQPGLNDGCRGMIARRKARRLCLQPHAVDDA
jgi:hypothetical protein